jgi:YidC/Oxa1 family membrane protein insertase
MKQMNKSSNPFGDNRTALAFFLSLIVIISYVQIFIEPSSDSQNRNAPISPTTSSPSSAEAIIPGGPLVGSNETGPVQVATEKSTPGAAQGSVQTILPTNRTLTAEQQEQLIQEEAMKYLSTLNDTPKLAVKTSLYTTEISQLGAQMLTFELEQYSKSLGSEERFNVIGRHVRTPLPFRVELLGGSDARIQFSEPVLSGRSQGAQITTTEDGTRVIELSDGEEAFATYQVDLKEGGTYTKTFRFVGGKFIIDVKASLSAPSVGSLPLKLSWSTFIPEELVSSRYDPINFSFLTTNDKVEHEQVTSLQDDAGRPVGNKEVSDARWGALGDKYFMAALVAKGSAQSMTASRAGNSYSLSVQGTPQEVEAQAYLGPKNYSQLKNMDFKELHRSVNLGFFSFLAIPLLSVINVFYTLIGNYGLAIIALTLAIKFLFLPLSQVSLKSMKAMQEIQPEVKALRERIKDANQLNQEMFALYKRKGVNPMGGCLPMLIQIPVFLGLYNALLNATELRHAPFALWITDLSAPEALMIFGIPVPIMIILMGISMFLQQWLMPSNMDEQQRKIMLLMPVVFTGMFIIFPFPSGLVLYWLVNNLISIVQQVYLRTEKNVGPVTATSVASIGIFLVAYLLTEIS